MSSSTIPTPPGVQLRGELAPAFPEIVSPEALAFVAKLQRAFGNRREESLKRRQDRQAALDRGEALDFLPETKSIGESDWRCAPIPTDLRDRRVEITGPTDRKMVINALNSGAKIFMADFEDANSPTWTNMVEGQINLRDAIRRSIRFTSPEGKNYQLREQVAVLLVRPRGWHLPEKHMLVDGKPVSGSLFDFGLYFFQRS
jgi:malate synthase